MPAVIYDEASQRMADQMVLAEAKRIEQRKRREQECGARTGTALNPIRGPN